jgi:hypothetical protein
VLPTSGTFATANNGLPPKDGAAAKLDWHKMPNAEQTRIDFFIMIYRFAIV